ncbi:MAG: tetratricopeptide repeat protein [Gemmatimonadetes bacterium]|nr:tetratricopeptide repeat protein [Gemmatimonadota bacterium]
MSWWRRLIGGRSDDELKPQRLDYLAEALTLERQGDFHAALTSYRLALRDKPDDHKVLMNMAIAYSRIGQLGEAERCYGRTLEVKPDHAGAHYGMAFLKAKRGDRTGAEAHLEAFLAAPGKADQANVEHAREALKALRSPAADVAVGDEPDETSIEPGS